MTGERIDWDRLRTSLQAWLDADPSNKAADLTRAGGPGEGVISRFANGETKVLQRGNLVKLQSAVACVAGRTAAEKWFVPPQVNLSPPNSHDNPTSQTDILRSAKSGAAEHHSDMGDYTIPPTAVSRKVGDVYVMEIDHSEHAPMALRSDQAHALTRFKPGEITQYRVEDTNLMPEYIPGDWCLVRMWDMSDTTPPDGTYIMRWFGGRKLGYVERIDEDAWSITTYHKNERRERTFPHRLVGTKIFFFARIILQLNRVG